MSSTFGTSSPFPTSDDRSSTDVSRRGEELLDRAVHGAHDTIDRVADTAAPHVQGLQESVSSATDAVQARAAQLRETGDEWADSLRATVRDNPIAALATAVAVGMLVARLTRR